MIATPVYAPLPWTALPSRGNFPRMPNRPASRANLPGGGRALQWVALNFRQCVDRGLSKVAQDAVPPGKQTGCMQ